jgi:cytochrome P450
LRPGDLDNADGAFSNSQSVFPWWISDPLRDLSPGGIVAMAGMLGYRGAIQTLDGDEHRRIDEVVRRGMKPFTAGEPFRELMRRQLDGALARARAPLNDGETVDLKAVVREVTLGVLAVELGLPESMRPPCAYEARAPSAGALGHGHVGRQPRAA